MITNNIILSNTYKYFTLSNVDTFGFPSILNAFIVISILCYFIFGVPYIKSKRSKFTFVDELLLLMAHVIKIDGQAGTKEKLFAEDLLRKEFGEQEAKVYIFKLHKLLNKNYSIKSVLKIIDYKESKPVKIQLLNNLIKITVVDQFLTDNEMQVLSQICRGLGLRPVRLTSMLSMYSYTTERDFKNSRRKKSTKKPISAVRFNAYKILGLEENATDKDIKKAYRKLVVLYHPDKVSHLDEVFKKEAKNKFLKINEAYDYLKEQRGFK